MLFEFYEKLINASSQTISSSFDYNSHDMLNKLRKFSRNKLRLKNNKYLRLLFLHGDRDIGNQMSFPNEEMDNRVPITMKTNNSVF